jgi:putative hemolysin
MYSKALLTLGLVMLAACAPKVAPSPDAASAQPRGVMAAADRKVCLAGGGAVERRGRMGAENCVHRYADAGKVCTDKADCSGKCLAESMGGSGAGSGLVKGICQADDSPFGCSQEVRKGQLRSGICVD